MKLQVLIIEDSHADAELNVKHLQKAGYKVSYKQVENAPEMIAALDFAPWDLIISDFSMPDFTVDEALEIYKSHGCDMPFIIVSGTIGEEKAVQLIKAGAHNSMLKNNMSRFIPIVQRELEEARNRRELIKLNASLIESEKKYRSYIDNAPDGVFIANKAGRYLEVNDAACRITGYSKEELLQMSVSDMLPPESLEEGLAIFSTMARTGSSNGEVMFRHKNGTNRWWAISGVKLSDSKFLGFAKDISIRKQSDLLLQQTRQNYETVFNTIDDFLFILDEQGNLVHTNAVVKRRLGYTAKELAGMSVLRMHPPERRIDAARIIAEMLNGTTDFCPIPLLTKSGNEIDVETKVLRAVWDGKPSILGVSKDVTRIRLSEEKFSKMFYLSPFACGLTDMETGAYTEVNEAFSTLLGFDKSEVIGKTPLELGILTAESTTSMILQIPPSEEESNLEVNLKAKNGDIKHVLLSAEKIYVHGSKYRITVVHDITKRKHDEELLQESELRYRAVTQSANDAIITSDSRGTITGWNHGAENIFGYETGEITGKNLTMIMPHSYAQQHHENILRILNSKDNRLINRTLEINGLHKNGHEFPIEISLSNWETASGKFFTGIIRDITRRKITEKILEEHKASLAAAQRIANIGSWDWHLGSNTVKWSDEMFKIFDIDPETHEGRSESLLKAIHPDDVESFTHSLNNNLANGNSPSLEYRIIRKDGEVRTIYSMGQVEFDEAGKPVRSIGTIQDITERKKAEEEIRRVNSFLDSIIDNIPDMIFIKDAKHLRFVRINRAGEALLGISSDELVGKNDYDFFPKEQADSFNAMDREVMTNRLMVDIPEEPIQTKHKGLRTLHTQKVPMFDAQGEPEYLLGISEDITDLKLAMQARKVSEEKYKTMLNASPDGILLIDLRGIITEASGIGLELFGAVSREDLVGKKALLFVPSEEKIKLRELYEKTMNEGLAQNIELKIRKRNRTLFPAEISTTLIQDPGGKPLSFMIIIRDISQRKKTETKQIHADRMANLGEMASGMAHEINQPLNIISMVMDKILFETAKKETIDAEFLAGKSEKIFSNITRIRNIIDHVRAFSRTHDDYIPTAFDLNSSIENAVSMITEQFKHLGITLNLMLDKQLPQVFGNTYKFEQVIINLLVNAKDAVIENKNNQAEPKEPLIEIRSYQENQFLLVEVADNGTGISSDDINNILLPFYTTKDEGKGTGLGLSICYQIIREMDGTIEILSNKPNGTTIKIVLNNQSRPENGSKRKD